MQLANRGLRVFFLPRLPSGNRSILGGKLRERFQLVFGQEVHCSTNPLLQGSVGL